MIIGVDLAVRAGVLRFLLFPRFLAQFFSDDNAMAECREPDRSGAWIMMLSSSENPSKEWIRKESLSKE